jgi:hypothetical protein
METEIMPGVFLTDFRTKKSDSNLEAILDDHLQYQHKKELLEADIKELNLQVHNLKRSNTEMIEVYREDPDPLYKEAIEENLILMGKKKKLSEELMKLLLELDDLYPQYPLVSTNDGPCFENEDNRLEDTNNNIQENEEEEGIYL